MFSIISPGKKYYCPYCGKGAAKLHLQVEIIYKNQKEVKHLVTLRGKAAPDHLSLLRNLDTSRHDKAQPSNRNNLSAPGGFQAKYRSKPSENTPLDDAECDGCMGTYHKLTLWKHQKSCSMCSPQNKVFTEVKKPIFRLCPSPHLPNNY